jgi:uncharacterized protein
MSGRFFQGLAFVVVALAVLIGTHRYIWARLVRDLELPKRWRIVLHAAFALLALSVPLAYLVGRRRVDAAPWGIGGVAWTWFGFVFYAVFACAAIDLVRWLVRRLTQRPAHGHEPHVSDVDLVDHGRRTLLARSAAGATTLLAGSTVAFGRRAAHDITTPEVEVHLERLPRALHGFTIAHLSDLHFGPLLGARFLDDVVAKTNALRPDLIVITGDLVDARVEALGPRLAALSQLRARHGVHLVTGNHEYYSGVEGWIAWLRRAGIRVLTNERVAIGDAGASFDLAGIPDRQGGLFLAEHAVDVPRTVAGRDPERELVLLAHRPAQITDVEGHGIGLQLSGHTHGGQLWPFGAIVALAEPYLFGLHRHDARTQIYVSRGTGFWGPPMRVANPSEIARIVLA